MDSGVFQGSPLSPLLFVLAAQPMAAHARLLATQQVFRPIRLPSGQPAPVMHQHADDTTVHARSPSDAQIVLDSSVGLHWAATGARLQRSKSQALGLGSLSHLTGPDPVTGVTFAATGGSVKHQGIPLSTSQQRRPRPSTQPSARRWRRHFPCHLRANAAGAARAALQSHPHLLRGEQASGRQRSSTLPREGHLLPRGKGRRHFASAPRSWHSTWQAAGARVAGLESHLRLLSAQERRLAGNQGARLALSAPPAYLAAGQIPTLLQFPSRADAGPGARAAVRACLPEAAASSPHPARRAQPR
ncbi:MAG: hypothetical protein IVW51_19280, partial [Thermaceae bacterium]|nr:hypothetical protein [Thermaceae bacterium]